MEPFPHTDHAVGPKVQGHVEQFDAFARTRQRRRRRPVIKGFHGEDARTGEAIINNADTTSPVLPARAAPSFTAPVAGSVNRAINSFTTPGRPATGSAAVLVAHAALRTMHAWARYRSSPRPRPENPHPTSACERGRRLPDACRSRSGSCALRFAAAGEPVPQPPPNIGAQEQPLTL
jgi:hypothetical protein